MKYEIKVMRAGTLVFVGEMSQSFHADRYGCQAPNLSEEEFDQAAFDIEKAINQQTNLRCHIERASNA